MNEVSITGKNNIKILNYYAEKAKEKIDINNNLHRIYNLYINYINEIKNILSNKEKIEQNITNLNNNLKNNINNIKTENQKLKKKYDDYCRKCTDELEMERPILEQVSSDNFTIKYSLLTQDILIQKLKSNLKNSRKYNIFREPKREDFLENKEGNIYIKKISEESQLDLLLLAKKYNTLKEKLKKRKQKINKLNENIEKLNEFINSVNNDLSINTKEKQYLISENKTTDKTSTTYSCKNKNDIKSISVKTKNFIISDNIKQYEEDLHNKKENNTENSENITNAILSTTIPNSYKTFKSISVNPILDQIKKNEIKYNKNMDNENGKINTIYNININKTKALSDDNRKIKKDKKQIKTKNKIIQSFLNLEDLFETDNENAEEDEALIDVILHSDDETILENKINQNKSISKTYLEKITKEIPKINLSLIEYNKLKVYQEIDIYSLQRRNYKGDNVENDIKILSKKIKKIKAKENLNSKKVKAMKKYIDDLKNKYIMYKNIKTKSSAINCEVKYFSNNEIIDLKNNDNENESIGSDYLNEDDEISES